MRLAIGDASLFVADVMQHEALRRTPLLPDRSSATLLGAPLVVEGKTVGAVAVLQPHVVGRLGRDLARPLSFWAQRLSGDLQLRHRSSAHAAARPGNPGAPASRRPSPRSWASGCWRSDSGGIVCFANAAVGRLPRGHPSRWIAKTRALVLCATWQTSAGADDSGVVSAVVGAH